jgi:hypothetical protein
MAARERKKNTEKKVSVKLSFIYLL